ncbi:MAG TPA: RecQ family ATP-dependent DNA helicase [Acidimicrobiales bacterium]|nr:RecQ family ATP-dependent DNA helicase [Acidimicrobiales bacterium]
MPTTSERIRRAAREGFGYRELRPGQLEAITALVEGTDVLAVMPTGSGKSAIYQVAGVLLDGPTVVVSPLISLQHDQVSTIALESGSNAVHANSTLKVAQRRDALAAVGAGEVEFLFLAPEQFANADTMDALRARPPSLFVVDEAHCISAWGHDFRTDYLHLGSVVEALGHPRVLALTATGTPPVRAEIVERLGMGRPRQVVQGFDRPNIRLSVRRFKDEDAKEKALLAATADDAGPGIVYAATRARAEALAARMAGAGPRVAAYHGGMPGRDRATVQDRFMGGDLDVVVATTAFGMGVDKPDVRFVFHLDVSDSLDAYYHEIGRAGRDGEPAEAVLFFRDEDLGLRRFFAGGARLDQEELARVVVVTGRHGGAMPVDDLAEATGLSPGRLATAIGWLARAGGLEVEAGGTAVRLATRLAAVGAVGAASDAAEARRRLDQSRVEMVRGYAETRGCRRRFLLGYFGEAHEGSCGACDNCEAGHRAGAVGEARPFASGQRVAHAVLGAGTVMAVEDEKVVVLFDDSGYKTLLLEMVVDEGLLRPEAS